MEESLSTSDRNNNNSNQEEEEEEIDYNLLGAKPKTTFSKKFSSKKQLRTPKRFDNEDSMPPPLEMCEESSVEIFMGESGNEDSGIALTVACKYCLEPYKFHDLDVHENVCRKSRIDLDRIPCPLCNAEIDLLDLDVHELTCSGNRKTVRSSTPVQPSVFENVATFIPDNVKFFLDHCSFCRKAVDSHFELNRHESGCMNNPNRKEFDFNNRTLPAENFPPNPQLTCEHCGTDWDLNNMRIHLAFCSKNRKSVETCVENWDNYLPPPSAMNPVVPESVVVSDESRNILIPCEFCCGMFRWVDFEQHQFSCIAK